MTMKVKITNCGPNTYETVVEVVDGTTVTDKNILKMGEETEVYIHNSRHLKVSEQDAPKQ